MRNLFLSEKRCISNLMQQKWGTRLHSEPAVLREHSSEPLTASKAPNFNCDFVLDFVEDFTEWRDRDGTMNTALPNTFGADLYLFVETRTFSPLHFELMFGGAFSMKYYIPYIARVEAAVRDAVASQEGVGSARAPRSGWDSIGKQSRRELLRRVAVRESASARVLVVGNDICFLYFPSDRTPVMRGSRFDLAESDDRQIACYLDGDEIVCFDGWVRTEVAGSDGVLIALPSEDP